MSKFEDADDIATLKECIIEMNRDNTQLFSIVNDKFIEHRIDIDTITRILGHLDIITKGLILLVIINLSLSIWGIFT